MGRWLVWFPALLLAGVMYWTVALGLGSLSLMTVATWSAEAPRARATCGNGWLDVVDTPPPGLYREVPIVHPTQPASGAEDPEGLDFVWGEGEGVGPMTIEVVGVEEPRQR